MADSPQVSRSRLLENDEPLREMCYDYRNAHPLHAEGCFQRIVQWVKSIHSETAHTQPGEPQAPMTAGPSPAQSSDK